MCYGPLTRICHWGPLTALGIIKFVTGMTIHCNGMWWPPAESLGGFINSLCFMSFSGLTLYNFLSAMYHGPGYLPLKWHPVVKEDEEYLQWCGVCEGYKAPRSHHCRKCGRCVVKMDHHCPWINNCVGWGNHAHFTAFLLFATFGCLHASIILGSCLYRIVNRVHYGMAGRTTEPVLYFGVYTIVLSVIALGFTIGVVIAVGMLLYFQVKAIVNNRTAIEDWILEKALYRRRHSKESFVFPYDLGTKRNIRQVVNFSCQPIGDGIYWPVAPGCDQYTLTREQLIQKSDKRMRTKTYEIIRAASGSWLPITQGFKVCTSPPCSDESRIRLEVGDIVSVNRWRKYWLFGEKVQKIYDDQQKANRVRGWFPRRCAVEITISDGEDKKTN